MTTPPSPASKVGIFKSLWQNGRLVLRLIQDPRVPTWLKLLPIGGVIYLISPIDLIPEMIAGPLGLIDDPAVLALAMKLFVDFAPAKIVAEHRAELAGYVGDDWKVSGADSKKPPKQDDDIIDAEIL